MVEAHCGKCHTGRSAVGGFDASRLESPASLSLQPRKWQSAMNRLREGTMPPRNVPGPSLEDRDLLAAWIGGTLKAAACADGITPAPFLVRRLNRSEYSATLRDLLNIHINAGHALPAEGAGGEGFDNAAETLFLSPIHAEKFLEAAKLAVGYAMRDTRSRAVFMTAAPGQDLSDDDAARKILEAFVPQAFRRPVRPGEVEKFLGLYRGQRVKGGGFDDAVGFALQAVLISPSFLFRLEEANPAPEPRLADSHAMASRLSYFLWGSTPDKELITLAEAGKLQDDEVLGKQVARLLKDNKAIEFAERFVEQWLNTRELGRDIKPDGKLFPEYYNAEIQGAIKYEPVIFFQEILAQDLPLETFLDASFTISTDKLQRFYGLPPVKDLRQQPKRVDLPANSHRGGILGMAAVLAVSSYPHRTSPVLRGKWVLDALLGTPPPPPPPNVPELAENVHGAAPRTLRERLSEHRRNPVCAGCHERMDPIGFGLENYDVLGRWRTEDAGQPVDAVGVLPDGTRFAGPEELKRVLLARKGQFARNLASKMMGYALGRGLTMEDHCAIDAIMEQLEKDGYRAQSLVRGIVLSVPFRYQAGTRAGAPAARQGARAPAARQGARAPAAP